MNFTEAIVLAVEKVKAWIQSGGVKWDHVSDKPFVKVGGDTLTWDGNTEGLEVFQGAYYKVSDAAPTMADLANGVTMTLHSNVLDIEISETISAENIGEEDGLIIFINSPESQSMPVVIVLADVNEEDFSLSKGTYFIGEPAEFIARSLTIPGYTGFAKEQIDPKVLPEALQFGKTTVQGDTLEWDGNTEGLVSAADIYYKISDAVPTKADCANGIEYDGDVVDGETVQGAFADDGLLLGEGILFIPSDNYTLERVTFPEAGVYFIKAEENYIHYLTIPGYSGFTKTEINTIKPEYLPGAVLLYADAEMYLYVDSDISDTNKRITKAELEKIALSGRPVHLGVEQSNGLILTAIKAFGLLNAFGVVTTSTDENYYTAEYTA